MDSKELAGQTIYSAELLYENDDHLRIGVFSTIEIAQDTCQIDANKYYEGMILVWERGESKPDVFVAAMPRGHYIMRPIVIDKPLFAYQMVKADG